MAARRRLSTATLLGAAVAGSIALNLLLLLVLPRLVHESPQLELPPPAQLVTLAPPRHLSPPPRQRAAQQRRPQNLAPARVRQRLQPQPENLHLKLNLRPQPPTISGNVVMPPVQLAHISAVEPVFDSTQLDQPLTPVARSPFIYPLRARRLGIEGWVKIRLLVSTAGTVDGVEVLEAQPPGVFEQTVKRGVRQWRFTPGTVGGEPVRSRVVTTVRFELD